MQRFEVARAANVTWGAAQAQAAGAGALEEQFSLQTLSTSPRVFRIANFLSEVCPPTHPTFTVLVCVDILADNPVRLVLAAADASTPSDVGSCIDLPRLNTTPAPACYNRHTLSSSRGNDLRSNQSASDPYLTRLAVQAEITHISKTALADRRYWSKSVISGQVSHPSGARTPCCMQCLPACASID